MCRIIIIFALVYIFLVRSHGANREILLELRSEIRLDAFLSPPLNFVGFKPTLYANGVF